MGDERNFEEMRDDVIAAFEESTDQLPNDYEMGEINALTKEYVDGSD